ncbi:MAG: enolase C-terminal domain-like protein [Candidatus Latescibacterota bacterium]|nr:enolase C-terminal domain-like protein [Candidatus Latescibacterota bacterium]
MKIRSVEVVRIERPASATPGTTPSRTLLYSPAGDKPESQPRRQAWGHTDEVANPMSKFPRFKPHRSLYGQKRWPSFGVKVTAEDGNWGIGTSAGRPAAAVVEDALAHILEGEECLAIEKCWDMMFRVTKPFGTAGIASLAISAVDLALWDLAGKIQGKPVYDLLGGPARDRIFCYATGNDVDWYKELGFKAFKLACGHGPASGIEGLHRNEEQIAKARELIGDDAELMLDCYMAFDVEYTVRLAERLRPYKLKWIEEYLIPEDVEGHIAVRKRLPWMTLASGEHFYTHFPYVQMINHRCLDILQPDIHWVGGMTACVKIAHMAESAGLTVCLHGGGRDPYGQHFTWAMPNTPWGEYYIGSDPGIPLEEVAEPGSQVPKNSWIEFEPRGPGFDLDLEEEWLKPFEY